MTLAVARKQAPDNATKAKRDSTRHAPPSPQRTRGGFPVPFVQRKPTCACGGGCPRCEEEESLQAKLRINRPEDRYEQEADRVAEQVVRMSDPGASGEVPATGRAQGSLIHRTCSSCDEEEKNLRAKEVPGRAPEIAPDIESRTQVLSGSGRPLPETTRAFFEPRFGFDFGQVRVHTDTRAAEIAQAVNARAFTLGSNVVFGAGQYAPETLVGQRLLAHELTHVVQQAGGVDARRTRTPQNKTVPQDTSRSRPKSEPDISNIRAGGDQTPSLQRQGGLVLDLAGEFLLQRWLGLDKETKLRYVDKAIDVALLVVDKFPGRELLGDAWIFLKEGLVGFYQSLKSAKEDIKIVVVDKIARIMAGRSAEYAKGMLIGLVKGFFIDGLFGIFITIWELAKALRQLWDFFDAVERIVAGFPEDIRRMLRSFRALDEEIAKSMGPAIDEIKRILFDPRQAQALTSLIVEQGKAYAKQGGQKIAESLLTFFSKPGAEAESGEAMGRVTGMVLFEVILAALTAGGAAAVTGVKVAGRFLAKIGSRIVGAVLTVLRELHVLLDPVINVARQAARFVKEKVLGKIAQQFGKLLEDVKNFIKRLLDNCKEKSPIVCKFPGIAKGKVAIEAHLKSAEHLSKRAAAFAKYLAKGGTKSKAAYEELYDSLTRNRLVGKLSEEQFQLVMKGEPKRYWVTVGGKKVRRDVDNVLGNAAREVKSGPLELTPFIEQQILKDIELIKTLGMKVEWHLLAGGDSKVIAALKKAGIDVILY